MEPALLSAAEPVRIQCAFTDRRGRVGAVTADVSCRDPLQNGCVRVVSVVGGGGRALYLNPAAEGADRPRSGG